MVIGAILENDKQTKMYTCITFLVVKLINFPITTLFTYIMLYFSVLTNPPGSP